jgi:hypothetical protein
LGAARVIVCLRGANAALARRRMRWGTETDGADGTSLQAPGSRFTRARG